MLYFVIIYVSAILLSALVSLFCGERYLTSFCFTALAVLIVVAIDGVVAGGARLLPKKFANHEKRIFSVTLKEKTFYEKLKIRKWKDKVPEIGHLTGFRKNKISDPKSVEYLDRFLLEICYGQIGHFFSCIFGFVLLVLFPIYRFWIPVSLPVAVINVFLNLPSLIILRYNSYKLRILRENLLKKQNKVD